MATGLLSWTHLQAQPLLVEQTSEFEFIFPIDNFPGYGPEEMVDNCGGTYPGAAAAVDFELSEDHSRLVFRISDAAPSTLFTIWLRLGAGGSPLTGGGSTPLANPSDIPALGAVTPSVQLMPAALAAQLTGDDGTGSAAVVNGLQTDADGNGTLELDLTFPLLAGSYPFSEFDASIADMALGNQPFALRIVSHCTDQVGHGLSPGKREAWFDLAVIPVPEPSGLGWMACFGIPLVRHCRRRSRPARECRFQ